MNAPTVGQIQKEDYVGQLNIEINAQPQNFTDHLNQMNKENKLEPIIIEYKEITLPDPVKSTVMRKPKELNLEYESEPENIEVVEEVVVTNIEEPEQILLKDESSLPQEEVKSVPEESKEVP